MSDYRPDKADAGAQRRVMAAILNGVGQSDSEALVPTQFAPNPAWSPEQRMWFHLLVQAVREASLNVRTRHVDCDAARCWLASRSEHVGSFRYVVRILDRDPDLVVPVFTSENLNRMLHGRSTGRHASMVA